MEQLEYTLVAVDPRTGKALSASLGFSKPPAPNEPAIFYARCMVCDREATAPSALGARDHAGKLKLARTILRELGCAHVHDPE